MKRNHGFTIIEILIVLAIIGILMAILFPVLKGVRERGNQSYCMSNLQQIGLAVAQYKNDEKAYPASLAFLLPSDFMLTDSSGHPLQANTGSSGWLHSTRMITCPDDDFDQVTRSSYGDISVARPDDVPGVYTAPNDPSAMSALVWNYFGYDSNGLGYMNEAEAAAAAAGSRLYDTTKPYNLTTNPIKYSLSNRYAPATTIITHCIFHRTQTGNGSDDTTTPEGAKDIILYLDGSARLKDVSNYSSSATSPNWQNQNS